MNFKTYDISGNLTSHKNNEIQNSTKLLPKGGKSSKREVLQMGFYVEETNSINILQM